MSKTLYYLSYISAAGVTFVGFYTRNYGMGFAGIGMLIANYGWDSKSRAYDNVLKSVVDLPSDKDVVAKATQNSYDLQDEFELDEKGKLVYCNGFKDGAEFIYTKLAKNLVENSNG